MKYSQVTTSNASNSAKGRACQDTIRFQNFVIVIINRETGREQDLDLKSNRIAGLTRKKLADRRDLRTLLHIFGCCLVSSFGFRAFIKLQDVQFVIVSQNVY